MSNLRCWFAWACFAALAAADQLEPVPWDTFSDTWVATDALGRTLPDAGTAGPPRPDRTVAMFYFLWHGSHIDGGPYDISRILAQDRGALQNPARPPWGPLHAPHHWGESVFGYYLSDDAAVLRAHARMLADAGVDVIVFDVTNQVTYKPYYLALLKEFAAVRRLGGKPPKVAFLCPFWDPRQVVLDLWRELYSANLHHELWFAWEGKPLILADPARLMKAEEAWQATDRDPVALEAGSTLGQSFTIATPVVSVEISTPTWDTRDAAATLTLRRDGSAGELLASQRFERIADNGWLSLSPASPLAPGTYYVELSDVAGRAGWWSHGADVYARGQAFTNGTGAAGDRSLRLSHGDEVTTRIRSFFTFRKPQPSYFTGPEQPDMWGWLEVFPQHVFGNAKGEKEMMTVGVAQNVVGDRLGSMSEPGARGRSFHAGATDTAPGAVAHGLNFTEQWQRALVEDPRAVFITGWNEWIAGRFAEFNGIRQPVMFVDQFDQEHSRDIEPMQGGHGDAYYYQLVANVRRYKGVRAPPPPCTRRSIAIADHAAWMDVVPEYRDDIGDPMHRDHPGWNDVVRYVDHTGRHDIVSAKVAHDAQTVWFEVHTRSPFTPAVPPAGMLLFIDVDVDHRTGWLGYDLVVNRLAPSASAVVVERALGGGYRWERLGEVPFHLAGDDLVVAIPRTMLGITDRPTTLDFKWADHIRETGDWSDFILSGDAAPNGRFNYRARLAEAGAADAKTP